MWRAAAGQTLHVPGMSCGSAICATTCRPTVAKVLGIGQSTVTFLTHAEPTFPKPIKISNATRWKAAEVIAWANTIQTNSFEITGTITPSAKNTKK